MFYTSIIGMLLLLVGSLSLAQDSNLVLDRNTTSGAPLYHSSNDGFQDVAQDSSNDIQKIYQPALEKVIQIEIGMADKINKQKSQLHLKEDFLNDYMGAVLGAMIAERQSKKQSIFSEKRIISVFKTYINLDARGNAHGDIIAFLNQYRDNILDTDAQGEEAFKAATKKVLADTFRKNAIHPTKAQIDDQYAARLNAHQLFFEPREQPISTQSSTSN